MKTSEIAGYFDVKVYRNGVEPKDRQLKGESEQITFNATFSADRLPKELSKFAKEYVSSRDGSTRFGVKFKIGSKVRWFNSNGQAITKIHNAELDQKKWRALIDFVELNGDPTKHEASGYWVNAIMLEEMPENPFEGMCFQPLTSAGTPPPTVTVDEPQEETKHQAGKTKASTKPKDTARLEEIKHVLEEGLDTSFEAHFEQM